MVILVMILLVNNAPEIYCPRKCNRSTREKVRPPSHLYLRDKQVSDWPFSSTRCRRDQRREHTSTGHGIHQHRNGHPSLSPLPYPFLSPTNTPSFSILSLPPPPLSPSFLPSLTFLSILLSLPLPFPLPCNHLFLFYSALTISPLTLLSSFPV